MKTIQSKGNIFTHDAEAEQEAIKIIGDGKLPNKFFLTLTNEVFIPCGEILEPTTLDEKPFVSVMLPFGTKEAAMLFIRDFIDVMDDDPETVKNVYLEDRLNGEIHWEYIEVKMVRQLTLNIIPQNHD